MRSIADVYQTVQTLAPFSLAESWDNAGLLVGSPHQPVTKVLVALDATSQVVAEAAEWGAELIVTHHPVIFQPIKSIPAESVIYKLVQSGIGLLSAHTNLDIATGGVNDQLAKALGLVNIRPLEATRSEPFFQLVVFIPINEAEAVYKAMSQAGAGSLGNYEGCGFMSQGEGRFLPGADARPFLGTPGILETAREVRLEMLVEPGKFEAVLQAMRQAHPYEEPAYHVAHNYACKQVESIGRIGDLDRPVHPEQLARTVKDVLKCRGLRYVPGREDISTVAVCGGSGADYLSLAAEKGAQALVTGESKHNQLLDAREMGITLVDAGHYSTENIVIEPLCNHLAAGLPELEVRIARSGTDPVYFV